MKFDVWTRELPTLAVDCIVLGVFEEEGLSEQAKLVDATCGGRLKVAVKRGDLSSNTGETLLLLDLPDVKASRVLLTQLGDRKAYNRKAWRKALGSSISALSRTQIRSAALALPRPSAEELNDYEFGRAIAEIVSSSLYRAGELKTGKKSKPFSLESIQAGPVDSSGVADVRRGLNHGDVVGRAMSQHRDLGNLPSNFCTPAHLADQARAIGKKYPSVKVKVLNEADLRRAKMGCFLAVIQGGGKPAHFLILEYRGTKATEAPIVLAGKGVTFDTGGTSFKPPLNMDLMKYDMLGAGTVLACLTIAAELRLPLNVVGLVAACENNLSPNAVKPGDIVTSASGQTVEILNTDAEGRLLLSDVLHYARRFDPDVVIDIATLTGSVIAALGSQYNGVMSNDDELTRELIEAGAHADDRVWQLPLMDEYAEPLKGQFADLSNFNFVGQEDAVSAAAFLSHFIRGVKWAHLDVAGTAYTFRPQKGVTGRPIPMLADFLIRRAQSHL